MIQITNKLQIQPNDTIIIPGCEPTSAVTSITLMRNQECCGAVVNLQDALDNIPGSYVERGPNYGMRFGPARWLVIPLPSPVCPCDGVTDWYQVLRDLACKPEDEITEVSPCLVNKFGLCPDPEYKSIPAPPNGTYFPEGSMADGSTSVTYQQMNKGAVKGDPYV